MIPDFVLGKGELQALINNQLFTDSITIDPIEKIADPYAYVYSWADSITDATALADYNNILKVFETLSADEQLIAAEILQSNMLAYSETLQKLNGNTIFNSKSTLNEAEYFYQLKEYVKASIIVFAGTSIPVLAGSTLGGVVGARLGGLLSSFIWYDTWVLMRNVGVRLCSRTWKAMNLEVSTSKNATVFQNNITANVNYKLYKRNIDKYEDLNSNISEINNFIKYFSKFIDFWDMLLSDKPNPPFFYEVIESEVDVEDVGFISIQVLDNIDIVGQVGGSPDNLQLTFSSSSPLSEEQHFKFQIFYNNGYTSILSDTISSILKETKANSIEILSGNNQVGIIDSVLMNPIKVLVKDIEGSPVPNIVVNFSVTSGFIKNTEVFTNSEGIAQTEWILGEKADTQILIASVFDIDGITHLQGSPLNFIAIGKPILVDYGSLTDIDGNSYKTVLIGNQTFMAENLKVTRYPNGDPILEVYNRVRWENLFYHEGRYDGYYRCGNEVLYNYAAAIDACPIGWHLPTDEEWTILVTFISSDGNAGTEGTPLKATSGWQSLNGTNKYGFNALPVADCFNHNTPSNLYLWSSTESEGNSEFQAYYRKLLSSDPYFHRVFGGKESGCSVRCIKD